MKNSGRAAGHARGIHRRAPQRATAAPPVRTHQRRARGKGPRRARSRPVLGARRTDAAAARRRRHPSRVPPGPAAAHAQRQALDQLNDDRPLRLRRLPRPSGMAGTAGCADAGSLLVPDSPPAHHPPTQRARFRAPTAHRKCARGARCARCIPPMRRPATSCGCLTTAAPAWPAPTSATASCRAWRSCPPAPGTGRAGRVTLCGHGDPNILTREAAHAGRRHRAFNFDAMRELCEVICATGLYAQGAHGAPRGSFPGPAPPPPDEAR